MIVFYSWQSDLPNSTNRGFIESALSKAASEIASDVEIDVEPVIDRDTSGVPGSPNIAETILAKIRKCAIFVADVSLIGKAGDRLVPNPNVLVELGYALHCLGPSRVVLIQNTSFGPIRDLPFDLRMMRVVDYEVTKKGPKAEVRRALTGRLETALRACIPAATEAWRTHDDGDVTTRVRTFLGDASSRIQLDQEVSGVVATAIARVVNSRHADLTAQLDEELYLARVQYFDFVSADLVRVFALGGAWAGEGQLVPFSRGVQRLLDVGGGGMGSSREMEGLGRYLAMCAVFAFGLGAIANEHLEALPSLLAEPKVTVRSKRRLIAAVLPAQLVMGDMAHWLPDLGKAHTPWSRHVARRLSPLLDHLLPSDQAFAEAFDRWELLLALQYWDRVRAKSMGIWVPIGDFFWRTSTTAFSDFRRQIEHQGDDWAFCRLGLITSRGEELLKLIEDVESFVKEERGRRGIWS